MNTWMKRLFQIRTSRTVGKARRPRPQVEALEERTLPAVTIAGTVWQDTVANGQRVVAEPALSGAVVEVFGSTDTTVGNADDVSLGLAITALDGSYSISAADAPNYFARVRIPPGFAFTLQDMGANATDSDVDATGASAAFIVSPGGSFALDAGVTGAATPVLALAVNGGGFDRVAGVAVDANGDAYLTGYFESTTDFDRGVGTFTLGTTSALGDTDAFVAHYTSAGALVWAREAGSTFTDQAYSVAVDVAGNTYVSGRYASTASFEGGDSSISFTTAGGGDVFVWKLDRLGNTVWVRSAGGASSEEGFAIALDPAGNAYVTGLFNSTATFNGGTGTASLTSAGGEDVFVWKLDTNGNTVWARQGGGDDEDEGTSIAVDSSGNAVITGYFNDTATFAAGSGSARLESAGSEDIFVWRLDAAGNTLWARGAGDRFRDKGFGVALDSSSNAVVTGSFAGTATFAAGTGMASLSSTNNGTDIYVWKLDAGGNTLWARKAGSTSNSETGSAIAVDSVGNAYSTGAFSNAATFGTGADTLTSVGGRDAYVWKLSSAGDTLQLSQFSGAATEQSFAIAVDALGNTYAGGDFSGTSDFDPSNGTFTLTSTSFDGFLTRIAGPVGPILVNTLDDTVAVDGVTSLREAILQAINRPGVDDIVFSAAFAGQTIILNGTALPTITDDLTITGPAGGLTLDAHQMSRILRVESGSTALSNLNLNNGTTTGSGGGILNNGSLSLTNCTLSNNSATETGGAITSFGPLAMIDCTVVGNSANDGGALYLTDTSSLTSSTFSNNTAAGVAGAIYNNTDLAVTACTLSGNSAALSGGGIYSGSGELSLTNCTLSGNSGSFGGGLYNNTPSSAVNCTFVLNTATTSGGGIYNNLSALALNNTIVAGNAHSSGPSTPDDITNNGGTITGGHNLIGDPNSAGSLTGNGNFAGNGQGGVLPIAAIIDTTLRDNGGSTLTHALAPNSFALETGETDLAVDSVGAPLATDQRGTGFPRVVGGSVDIGAFEAPLMRVRVGPDPSDAALMALFVMGDASDNTIRIRGAGKQGVEVTLDGESLGTFSPTGSLIVEGGEGADEISVTGTTMPSRLYGGPGADSLTSGGGDDVLMGGSGDDILKGGNRRDLLIGGTGRDILKGQRGQDILVAGSTLYDESTPAARQALDTIMAVWAEGSRANYESRIVQLRDTGVGTSNSIRLSATTVSDDSTNDELLGSPGDGSEQPDVEDWFLANEDAQDRDTLRDRRQRETLTDIDSVA